MFSVYIMSSQWQRSGDWASRVLESIRILATVLEQEICHVARCICCIRCIGCLLVLVSYALSPWPLNMWFPPSSPPFVDLYFLVLKDFSCCDIFLSQPREAQQRLLLWQRRLLAGESCWMLQMIEQFFSSRPFLIGLWKTDCQVSCPEMVDFQTDYGQL